MTYLRNCWYIAAWSQELPAGVTLARTLLDLPVTLFRGESGRLAALFDRCPHRFAPLSGGKIVGDGLQCPYHGLEFGPDGRCAKNPYGPVLRAAQVPAYPVAEKHRAIWIWMGDPAVADEASIPDLAYLGDAPASAFSAGYLHSRANYEILVDNIMDLTHTDYLHATSIAGTGLVHKVRPRTRETDEFIEVTWAAEALPLSPFHTRLHPELSVADSITRVTWYAPAVMKLLSAIVPPGEPEESGYINMNAHLITPETATTCHYFFAATRNYRVDDVELNETIAKARSGVFEFEDKPTIEAVQSRMGSNDFWDLKPLLLGVDEAAVRARRRLSRLIEMEASASSQVSAAG